MTSIVWNRERIQCMVAWFHNTLWKNFLKIDNINISIETFLSLNQRTNLIAIGKKITELKVNIQLAPFLEIYVSQ